MCNFFNTFRGKIIIFFGNSSSQQYGILNLKFLISTWDASKKLVCGFEISKGPHLSIMSCILHEEREDARHRCLAEICIGVCSKRNTTFENEFLEIAMVFHESRLAIPVHDWASGI